MSEGSRPGGLTALAVLNFIGGAFSVLFVFGCVLAMLVYHGTVAIDDEARENAIKAIDLIGMTAFQVQAASYVASTVLLIASGVGYLRQSRFWGRTLGNAYGVVSIVLFAVFLYLVHEKHGTGFDLGAVIWLLYPVLTLILLNSTFREDFTR